MSFADSIAAWFNGSITVKAAGAPSSSGDPAWGSPTTVAARVEPSTRVVMGPGGTPSQSVAVLYTTTKIGPYDQITLAGDTVARKPLEVLTEMDPLTGQVCWYQVTL